MRAVSVFFFLLVNQSSEDVMAFWGTDSWSKLKRKMDAAPQCFFIWKGGKTAQRNRMEEYGGNKKGWKSLLQLIRYGDHIVTRRVHHGMGCIPKYSSILLKKQISLTRIWTLKDKEIMTKSFMQWKHIWTFAFTFQLLQYVNIISHCKNK